VDVLNGFVMPTPEGVPPEGTKFGMAMGVEVGMLVAPPVAVVGVGFVENMGCDIDKGSCTPPNGIPVGVFWGTAVAVMGMPEVATPFVLLLLSQEKG